MKTRLSVEHLEHRRLLCGSAIGYGSSFCNDIESSAATMLSISAAAAEYDLGEIDGARNIRGTVGCS